MSERTLAGKRVVVVGASAGIGRAFAVRAGKEGAELLIAARRRDRLEEVAIEAGCGSAVIADVRSMEDCARLADVARDALGGIDLLFISVGYAPLRMFADTSADETLTNEFLAARIENVMQFEKFKAKAKEAFANFPAFTAWAKPKK